MSILSRRTFMQQSGVVSAGALLGMTLGAAEALPAVPDLTEQLGRAFAVTPIHAAPDPNAPRIGTLHPDAVTPILRTHPDGRWYQLPDGYVPRRSLQPLMPYMLTTEDNPRNGTYGEVIAPVSTVRAWAGAHAPIRARLGQGAVVYIADRLTDDRGLAWLGVADGPESPMRGWSPAAHLAPRTTPTTTYADLHLHMEVIEGRLAILHGDRLLAHVPALLSPDASPLPFGTAHPLALMSSGLTLVLYGVYWHNDFVREPQETCSIQGITGKVRIELPTYAARWLWHLASDGADPLAVTFG
jgi:hypothetical protein